MNVDTDIATQITSRELINIRRHLHKHPELSWQERKTAHYISDRLNEWGLEPETGKARGTGQWLDIVGEKPGPILAYRADIDALPIWDRIQRSYKSAHPGVGHECGHDVHTTVALGLANFLNRRREEICGTIRILWQPAEESQPSGAPAMIADGAIKNVSAIFAIHVDPTLESGTIASKPGPLTAAYRGYYVHFEAPETLHSARPHSGPNAFHAALQFAGELESLVSRRIDVRNPAVLAVTQFNAGDALNVIPKAATVGGTMRTRLESDGEKLVEAIKELADYYHHIYKVKVKPEFTVGSPSVINETSLAEFGQTVIRHSQYFKLVDFNPSMGGEDFAYYTKEIPGLMLRVGTRKDTHTAHPLHSDSFDIDESVMFPLVGLLSDLLINYSRHLS